MTPPLRSALAAYFLRPGPEPDRPAPSPDRRTFVAPRAPRPGDLATAARVPEPPALALLAGERDAWRLGAAIALAGAGSGVGLLALWRSTPGPGATAPAVPAARRLVGALASRGLEATARGRLVVVALDDDEGEAVGELRTAELVPGPAIHVLALGAARGEAWTGALFTRDLVCVHGEEPALVELAVARLRADGAHARALDPAPPPAACTLAASGVVLPGTLRSLRDATAVGP